MLQLAEHQDVIDKQSLQQLRPRASPTYLIVGYFYLLTWAVRFCHSLQCAEVSSIFVVIVSGSSSSIAYISGKQLRHASAQ